MTYSSLSSAGILLTCIVAAGTFAEAGCNSGPNAPAITQNEGPQVTSGAVLAWGDSLTKGVGLESADQAFPARLAEKVRAEGLRNQVLNRGQSGFTALEAVGQADAILATPGIGVLLLELGGGDSLRGTPVAAIEANLAAIIVKAKARNVLVVLCQIETDARNGTAYQTAFRAIYPALAAQYGVSLTPSIATGLEPADIQLDGLHPTASGHQKIAGTIWPVLRPLLR